MLWHSCAGSLTARHVTQPKQMALGLCFPMTRGKGRPLWGKGDAMVRMYLRISSHMLKIKIREDNSSRSKAASHSKKAGTQVEISRIILSHWNPTEKPLTNGTRSPFVLQLLFSSRDLTAPVAFPVGSAANTFRAQSRHLEWGKQIHSTPTLSCSLHPVFRQEPFANWSMLKLCPWMLQLGRCPALFQKLHQRHAEPCSC